MRELSLEEIAEKRAEFASRQKQAKGQVLAAAFTWWEGDLDGKPVLLAAIEAACEAARKVDEEARAFDREVKEQRRVANLAKAEAYHAKQKALSEAVKAIRAKEKAEKQAQEAARLAMLRNAVPVCETRHERIANDQLRARPFVRVETGNIQYRMPVKENKRPR